jgi:hypothetical protein
MWTIALLGTDVFINPDDKSQVLLSSLGYTDPMTNADWGKYDVLGAPTQRQQIAEIQDRNGVAYHSGGQKKVIRLEFDDFIFPDDEHKRESLENLLNYPFIYFFKGTYDFANWEIHEDLYCLAVACTKSVENIFEDAVTRVSMDLQLVNPVAR